MGGKTGSPSTGQYKELSRGPIAPASEMERKIQGPAGSGIGVGAQGSMQNTSKNVENIDLGPAEQKTGEQSPALQGAIGAQNSKNLTNVDTEGNIQLGDPKVYDSVGSAGSGFVNLSHLLSLNKASGERSANDLARRTKAGGEGAMAGISGLEGQFVDAQAKGMENWRSPGTSEAGFDPGGADAQKWIDSAHNAKYTGPNDLSELGAYGDLAKKVGNAQDMAKATQSGYGVAGQVEKETGLSPTQAAASSFYMGVNNPNLKRAGSAFTNLSAALEQANSRAMNQANLSRGEAQYMHGQGDVWQNQKNDYDTTAASFKRDTEATTAQNASDAEAQARQDILDHKGEQKNDLGHGDGGSGLHANSDQLWNIQHGMPSELSYGGINYDDWVAAGSPTYETWIKTHPQDASGYRRKWEGHK